MSFLMKAFMKPIQVEGFKCFDMFQTLKAAEHLCLF